MRGTAVTLAGQWTRYGLQIVSTIVLARLLTPEEYGVIGMAAVVVAFGEVVRDFGVTNGAIQRPSLTSREQSTLFLVSAGAGLGAGLFVAAGAGALASFYGTPEVRPVALALSVIPVVGGLTSGFIIDLSRSMRFGDMAVSDVSAMTCGVIAAVGLALIGAGVWALVALQLVQATVRLALVARASTFRPGRAGPISDVVPILRFGRNLFVVQMLDFATRNVDNAVIGRTAGAASLGQYTRAYQLLMLPLQQINAPLTRVVLPVLSRLVSDQPRYMLYLRTATTAVAYLGCVVLAVSVMFAQEIVALFLGPQWAESADIFRALAVAGVVGAVGYVNYWIFMSMDRTHLHLRLSLVTKPITIGAFVLGANWGAIGVAIAYSIVSAATLPVAVWWACRGTFVDARVLMGDVLRPAGLCAAVALPYLVVSTHVGVGPGIGVTLGVMALLAAVIRYAPSARADVDRLQAAGKMLRGPETRSTTLEGDSTTATVDAGQPEAAPAVLEELEAPGSFGPAPDGKALGIPALTAATRERGGRIIIGPWLPHAYLDLLVEGLEQALPPGYVVHGTRRITFRVVAGLRGRRDVLHLQWLEYVYRPGGPGPVAYAKGVARALVLLGCVGLARARGVRVVWTVHNRRPHDTPTPRLDALVANAAARLAHSRIVHSEFAKTVIGTEQKSRTPIEVMPFGSFARAYPTPTTCSADIRAALGIGRSAVVALAFGQIRPYKQFGELVREFGRVVNPNARLIIAGNPADAETTEQLQSLASDDERVIALLRHIPDEDVSGLHLAADFAVVPYQEVFSSAALMLNFSLGLTSLVPSGGSAEELGGPPIIEAYPPGGLREGLERLFLSPPTEAERAMVASAAEVWTWRDAAELLIERGYALPST